MKRNSKLVGLCIMASGLMIMLACFLPAAVLVCVQAALLIVIGFCYFCL